MLVSFSEGKKVLSVKREQFDIIAKWCAVSMAFFLPLSTALTDITFVLTIALTLLAGRLRGKLHLIMQTRVLTIMLLLFTLVVIGMLYSSGDWASRLSRTKHYSHLLLSIFILPLIIEDKYRRYALTAFLSALILSVTLSYLKAFGVVVPGIHYHGGTAFKSHIEMSYLMSFAAYILGIYLMQSKRYQIWFGLGIILITFFIFFLNTGRTGYLTYSALFILFSWQYFKLRYLFVSFIILSLLFTISYFAGHALRRTHDHLQQYARHQGNYDTTSVGLRLEFYQNSLKLIKQHPIIGTGTGSFYHQYQTIRPVPPSGVITSDPTNEYLNIGVQYGIIGLLLMLWLFVTHWQDSFDLPEPYNDIARGVVLSFAVGCLVNSWLMSTTEGHFYSYFVALLFASLYDTSRKQIFIRRKSLAKTVYYYAGIGSGKIRDVIHHPETCFVDKETRFIKNKPDDTTTVVRLTVNKQQIVVKRYNFRNVWHGVKLYFRPSKAMRSWHNIQYLQANGIATIRPIAVVENRLGPLYGKAYLFTYYENGMTGTEYFAAPRQNYDAVLHAMGQLIKNMYQARIHHGDFRLENLLVVEDKVLLVDLDHLKYYSVDSWWYRRLFKRDIQHFMNYVRRDFPHLADQFERVFRGVMDGRND